MGNRVESFFAGEEVLYEAFRKRRNGQQITASVTLSDAQKIEPLPGSGNKPNCLYDAGFKLAYPGGDIERTIETSRLTPNGFGVVFQKFEDFVAAAYKSLGIERDFSEREARGVVYDLQRVVEADFCDPNSEEISERWVVDGFGRTEH